jgi:hypothetical protein
MFMDDRINIVMIVLGVGICLVLLMVSLIVIDLYKERQWRIKNPDEHNIMNRKIKDDFSE